MLRPEHPEQSRVTLGAQITSDNDGGNHGAQQDSRGECVPCNEVGMDCLGMNEVYIKPGFSWYGRLLQRTHKFVHGVDVANVQLVG